MNSGSFFAAVKISLTLFALWRLARFSQKHRTLEGNAVSVALIILMALVLRGQNPVSEHEFWVLLALNFLLGVLILEPECSAIAEQLGQKIRKSTLDEKALEELVRAAAVLSATRTGALIAIERGDDLLKPNGAGIEINAEVKSELITALFNKHAQTHDGGALIRSGRITHCGVIFPLTDRTDLASDLGTRHRAGIGLSEQTDALCLIVSEESGSISLASQGELIEHILPRNLMKTIRKLLHEKQDGPFLPFHYLRRFSLIQENGLSVSFSKSMGNQIHHAIAVLFWLLVAFLWNTHHQKQPIEILTGEPWSYGPAFAVIFHAGTFLLTHKLSVNGLAQQVTEERRFLGFCVFRKTVPLEKIMNVYLKKERTGINLWCLALVFKQKHSFTRRAVMRRKRSKLYLIERASSPKILSQWAQKIGVALAPPLAATLSETEQEFS